MPDTPSSSETTRPVLGGECVNCGHDDHYGERCEGLADDDWCACSWPDPSNFVEPPTTGLRFAYAGEKYDPPL